MKTHNDIQSGRGFTSTSGLNQIKKVAKWIIITIASIIALTLWAIIKPILKGIGWVISVIAALATIYWILTTF